MVSGLDHSGSQPFIHVYIDSPSGLIVSIGSGCVYVAVEEMEFVVTGMVLVVDISANLEPVLVG